MTSARRFLHQLRYALVNNYYKDQKLQLTNSQIEDDVAAQTEPRARAEVRFFKFIYIFFYIICLLIVPGFINLPLPKAILIFNLNKG